MYDIVTQSAHAYQLSEFRDHCRIPWTDDDPALTRSLDAAVLAWERMTSHFTRATTIDMCLAPGQLIPFGPDPTLVSVTARDLEDDTTETVTSDWDIRRGWGASTVHLRPGSKWYPSTDEYTFRISTTGSSDAVMKSAIFGIGEHLFQHRGVVESAGFQDIPYTVRAIVSNYQKGTA